MVARNYDGFTQWSWTEVNRGLSGEFDGIILHLTSARVVIIVRGISVGPMFRGVSLIWEIPVWIPVRGDRMGGRAVLYYDGECGMCAMAARWAGRFDWLHRLESRGSIDEEAHSLGMTSVDLDGAMQLVSPNGEIFSGFHALRQVMLRLPLMWLVAPLTWAPGAALAGSWVYRWVAQRRNAWCGNRS